MPGSFARSLVRALAVGAFVVAGSGAAWSDGLAQTSLFSEICMTTLPDTGPEGAAERLAEAGFEAGEDGIFTNAETGAQFNLGTAPGDGAGICSLSLAETAPDDLLQPVYSVFGEQNPGLLPLRRNLDGTYEAQDFSMQTDPDSGATVLSIRPPAKASGTGRASSASLD